MNDEINASRMRKPGRPKGSPNRIKRKKPLDLAGHVDAVLADCELPDTPNNRILTEQAIVNPAGKLIQQVALGQRVRHTGAPRLLGRMAQSEKLEVARAEMLPTVRMAAIERAPSALNLLIGFVTGEVDAPAGIRRLAALDILAIAGISTGPAHPEPGSQKPVSELSADQLRAILEQQQGTLAALQQELAGDLIECEKVPEKVH